MKCDQTKALARAAATCLLAVTLFAAVRVHADTAANAMMLPADSPIAAYLKSREALQQLYDLGRAHDATLGLQQDCKGGHSIHLPPAAIVILEPIHMSDGALHPNRGAWQYKYGFERCGEVQIYNALVVAQQGQPPRYISLMPGRTLASPLLMRDTLPVVMMKVAAESRGVGDGRQCDDFAILDSTVTLPPRTIDQTKRSIGEAWEEGWTVRYCGKAHMVPVCFSPDGAGGTSFTTKSCGR